jgi:hypothetical protein
MGINESVFFSSYRSVFLGIYHTNTEGKLGQYFLYQNLAGAPQKICGSPLFPKKGGPRPPFWTLHPTFEEKKEFPLNFSKKEFPRNLKKVFPPKLTVLQYLFIREISFRFSEYSSLRNVNMTLGIILLQITKQLKFPTLGRDLWCFWS